jgi:hypothetical protein
MICKTWSRIKCHVKTACGVSTNSYISTLTDLLYGLGQGSTLATDLWGLHGLVINALALSFIGILIISVSKQCQHERICEGFIDDTGLGTTHPYSTAITQSTIKALTIEERELHTKANGILRFFLDLLTVIGGDLHSGESACFLMFHRWAGGKATLRKIHDDHPSVSLTHPITGITNVVQRKDRDDPHRALGWMMTIDRKSTGPFNTLKKKAQHFASAIYGSRMRRQDASLAYNCYYIANIGYTLASTKIPVNQCDAIQSPVVCAILNKMGINRNVARNIVFGPKALGGLEMHDLYTIQGTKRLQYFLGHVMCNDGNGNLKRICV